MSVDDFASDPIDRYWLGATQLVWCQSPTVCGTLHWGRPSATDIDELACALELARHPSLSGGFDILTDARAIDRVDRRAYFRLTALVREHASEWRHRVRHHAVLVRPGPTAAVLAGMAPLAGLDHEMCFVVESDVALDWLRWTARLDALAAVEETARLASEARGIPAVVKSLRDWLAHALIGPTVEAAASALAMSVRTLQRELCEAGTSFTSELQAARVRVACELLRDTEDKVDTIARAVGSTSASQLSVLFRRQLGITPARYRMQHANQQRTLEVNELTVDTVDIIDSADAMGAADAIDAAGTGGAIGTFDGFDAFEGFDAADAFDAFDAFDTLDTLDTIDTVDTIDLAP